MGELRRVELLDLGGGLNNGSPATHIDDRQLAEALDFYPVGPRLKRRAGSVRLNATAIGDELTGLFAAKNSAGVWRFYAGARFSQLYQYDPVTQAFSPVPSASGNLASDKAPWVFVQYKDVVYAVRRGTNGIKRVYDNLVSAAGIPAPAVAPTLADGAAGAIPAASFQGVYEFFNTITGARSNYSPVSVVHVHTANTMISWSGVAVSSNTQVNARRLFRTLPDQTGRYFFVATINNNTVTTFTTDNVLAQNLGPDEASLDNDVPPSTAHLIEIHNERMYLADETDILVSDALLPESISPDLRFPIFPDDGFQITALRSYGDRLVVGKQNAIHYLVGTDRASFAVLTLSDRHGCIAHHTMQTAERQLFWFEGTDFYRSDGSSVDSITTDSRRNRKMTATLESLSPNFLKYAVSAIDERRGLYMTLVPTGIAEIPSRLLVYDYRADSWSIFTTPASAGAYFIGRFPDAVDIPQVYIAGADGRVHRFFEGATDGGTAITGKFRTKEFGYESQHGYRKGIRHIQLLCSTIPRTATIRVYCDGVATVVKQITASLAGSRGWKRFSLSTLRARLGATFQLEVEYSGNLDFEIQGLVLEVITFAREGQPS